MKQTKISLCEYNVKMAEIIKKGKPVADTLAEMLGEASKYQLPYKRKKTPKCRVK